MTAGTQETSDRKVDTMQCSLAHQLLPKDQQTKPGDVGRGLITTYRIDHLPHA